MPEIKIFNIEAQNLRNGDIISTANGSIWPYGAVVETVIPKNKWTVIRDVNGNLIQRCTNETKVIVERNVPTAEENAERANALKACNLRIWMDNVVAAYNKAKMGLMHALDDDPLRSTDHLYEMMEYERVRLTFCRMVNKVTATDEVDIVTAANTVLNEMVKTLLQGMHDPCSTALSFNNACMWIEHKTMRSIIREMEYNIGYDMGGIL